MARRQVELQGRLAADIDGLPSVSRSTEAVLYYDASHDEVRVSRNGGVFRPFGNSSEDRPGNFDDFLGPWQNRHLNADIVATSDGTRRITTTNGNVASGLIRINRPGIISGIQFIAGTNIAADSDTNYVTFAVTNKSNGAAGATALLAATDANTTKLTGGSAYTAFATRSLSLTATSEDLAVASGDILQITVTTAGTLGAVVLCPCFKVSIREIADTIEPRVTRATNATAPQFNRLSSEDNGALQIKLHSANVQLCGRLDNNDRLDVNAFDGPIFRARVKVSGVSANQQMVWGFSSADPGATFDNATYNAWFRLEGASLAVVWETDDNTTDTDDQATGFSLVADTYADFEIDMTTRTAILFKINGSTVGTGSLAAIPNANHLQRCAAINKASGTSVDSMTVDYIGEDWKR